MQVATLISQELYSSKTRFKDFKEMVELLYPTPPFSLDRTFSSHDYNLYTNTNNNSTTFSSSLSSTIIPTTIQIPTREPFEDNYIGLDLDIPLNPDDLDEDEWYKLLERLSISIEYHNKHLLHLQLLQHYGKQPWINAIQDSIAIKSQLEATNRNFDQNIEYINKVRKYRQEQVKEELFQMKEKVGELVIENTSLLKEIEREKKRQKLL
jgi:hypothetical protein